MRRPHRQVIGLVVALLVVTGLVAAAPRADAAAETASGIAHRASSTGGIATPGTALTLNKPAGTVAGDLLVARVANRDNVATTMAPPAGWTSVTGSPTASSGLLKAWLFTKVATASEPASYTFTLSAAFRMAGSISAYSGVDPLSPTGAYTGKVNGNSTAFVGSPVTSAVGNEVALWFGTQLSSATTCPTSAITPPAGFTEPVDTCLASTNGLVYDAAYARVGSPALQPAWSGSSAVANTNIVQVLTLRPAGVGIDHRATTAAVAAGATSLTIARPAGTAPGDQLLARVTNRNNINATLTPPTGWTVVRDTPTTFSLRTWIFTKTATAAEPASYAFTSSVALNLGGSVSAFSGVDTARPVDTSEGKYNSSTTVFTTGAITTTAPRAFAVWFGTQASTTSPCPASAITPPPGFTETNEVCVPSTSTGLTLDVATSTLGAAGLQPVFSGSSPQAATNVTQVVALRPAPPTQAADTYATSHVNVGTFSFATKEELWELSGIAASKRNPGIAYVHSEDTYPSMAAINTANATIVGRYTVPIPNQYDWEDIATGPCPTGSCIFAADIGTSKAGGTGADNDLTIFRVAEPDIAGGQSSGSLTGDSIRFRYPGNPSPITDFNSEAVMVHPRTGRIYVILKKADGISAVYALPVSPSTTTINDVTLVATLTLPTTADTNVAQVTAAAIHPSENRFLVRTYRKVYEYRGPAGGDFSTALTGTRFDLTDTGEGQGEAIDYALDGSAYFTVSESETPTYTLRRVDRR